MQYLLPSAVFVLMVSLGMSLRPAELIANWRELGALAWLRLLGATFVAPPALALLLARGFRLDLGETAGLFMVGVAPGAPLLTRNLARKGFDMHIAASYQIWAALMVPLMLPVTVMAAGKLYQRDIWISPLFLLVQIVEKQFLPLALGLLFDSWKPMLSARLQPKINIFGNVLLTMMIVLVLFKMGPALKQVTPLVPVSAAMLAVGSILAMRLFQFRNPLVRQTFAVCNANRHVGLALLLSGHYLHARNALPTIACYALAAPLVMFGYVKLWPVNARAENVTASGG